MVNKKGSALLLATVVLSAVLILYSLVWRTVAFNVDVSLQRLIFLQRFYGNELVLQYAVSLAQQHFATLIALTQKSGSCLATIDSFLLDTRTYTAQLEFTFKTPVMLSIHTKLFDKEKLLCEHLCILRKGSKEIDGLFFIEDWHMV